MKFSLIEINKKNGEKNVNLKAEFKKALLDHFSKYKEIKIKKNYVNWMGWIQKFYRFI